jgi:hypothetical protein
LLTPRSSAISPPPRPNSGDEIWAERKSYASSDEQRTRPVGASASDDPAQTGGDDYQADLRHGVQIHSSQIRPNRVSIT